MRLRSRSVVVALVAVFAFGAVASASASAAEWFVGGSALTGSTELAPATKALESIRLESSNGSLSVTCKGIELNKATIAAKTGGQIEHLVFKECSALPPCELKSETIESKPLKLEAALGSKSPEDTVLLKPVTGTVFAEFTLQGASCLSAGVVQLKGNPRLTMPKGREELAEQELRMSTGAGELNWSGLEVLLSGKVKIKLASGKGWSFH